MTEGIEEGIHSANLPGMLRTKKEREARGGGGGGEHDHKHYQAWYHMIIKMISITYSHHEQK